MVKCALDITLEQLQNVAVVSAALRNLSATTSATVAGATEARHSAHVDARFTCQCGLLKSHSAPTESYTGHHTLTPKEVEGLLAQHIRAHSPEPADLHRLLPILLEAALGVERNGVLKGEHGAAPRSGHADRQTVAAASEGRGQASNSKMEQDVGELMVNVKGMPHDPGQQAGDGKAVPHRWGTQAAAEAAQALLGVCLSSFRVRLVMLRVPACIAGDSRAHQLALQPTPAQVVWAVSQVRWLSAKPMAEAASGACHG